MGSAPTPPRRVKWAATPPRSCPRLNRSRSFQNTVHATVETRTNSIGHRRLYFPHAGRERSCVLSELTLSTTIATHPAQTDRPVGRLPRQDRSQALAIYTTRPASSTMRPAPAVRSEVFQRRDRSQPLTIKTTRLTRQARCVQCTLTIRSEGKNMARNRRCAQRQQMTSVKNPCSAINCRVVYTSRFERCILAQWPC